MIVSDKSSVIQVSDLGYKAKDSQNSKANSQPETDADTELHPQISSLSIDRRNFKDPQEFDVYESLIQGEMLHKDPCLITETGTEWQDAGGESRAFEVRFDKPVSLLSAGIELYFDADVQMLRETLRQQILTQTDLSKGISTFEEYKTSDVKDSLHEPEAANDSNSVVLKKRS